jgi:hypothetical protein
MGVSWAWDNREQIAGWGQDAVAGASDAVNAVGDAAGDAAGAIGDAVDDVAPDVDLPW